MSGSDVKQLCSWCHKPVSQAEQATKGGKKVCTDCYRLLLRAGVTEDEIFADKVVVGKNSPIKEK